MLLCIGFMKTLDVDTSVELCGTHGFIVLIAIIQSVIVRVYKLESVTGEQLHQMLQLR